MKRFDDLTDEEVRELSQTDFEKYIELECAFAGAPMLPTVPECPVLDVTTKEDRTLYTIQALHFVSREDADKVAALANNMQSRRESRYQYHSSGGSGYTEMPPDSDVIIGETKVFSAQTFENTRVARAKYAEDKKRYDSDKTEFDKVVKMREAVTRDIIERRERVLNEEYQRRQLLLQYERYKELANGDEKIAAKFLHNAQRSKVESLLPDIVKLAQQSDVQVKTPVNAPVTNELPQF